MESARSRKQSGLAPRPAKCISKWNGFQEAGWAFLWGFYRNLAYEARSIVRFMNPNQATPLSVHDSNSGQETALSPVQSKQNESQSTEFS